MAKRETRLWFLLPVFLSLIGGIIGYFLIKGKDVERANQVFLVGLFIFLGTFGIGFAFEFFNSFNLITPFSLLT